MARILVVDDDRINRVVLTRFLEAAHHEVATAETGEQAIELFPSFNPDIVLLDVIMPGMDGFETTRVIKRLSGSRHVPVLLLTALSDEESLVRGISAGADDFISKPVNRVVLNSRLYASLRTQRLFTRLAAQHQELRSRQEKDDLEQRLAERLMANVMRSPGLSDHRIRSFSRALSLFNGDLLLAEQTADGGLRLLLGDFSGHGLHAAIGAMPVATMFRQMTEARESLRCCLSVISEQLRKSLPTEMFFAACALELDPRGELLEVWNCGMPDVLIRARDGTLEARVESTVIPLGIAKWSDDWTGRFVTVEERDRIFIYSDGLFEVRDDADCEWGMDRLEDALRDRIPTHDIFDHVLHRRAEWAGAHGENDDVTLVELVAAPAGPWSVANQGRPSHFDFHLGADLLKSMSLGALIESIVAALPLETEHRVDIATILTELVTNAVDHGVLGIDSAIKSGPRGFARYHEIREEALRSLRSGHVDMRISTCRSGEGHRVRIRVRDSGRGFVYEPGPSCPAAPWGRGLTLVNELSDRLRFHGPGNLVEAEYVLEPERVPVH